SAAQRLARERSDIDASIERYYAAFEAARAHAARRRAQGPFDQVSTLCRWAAVHTMTAALGTIRKPAIVNRNGSQHPSWDDTLASR
ncbi:MAG TPA: hypothetical protein VM686_29660, partial [Polyangiaceae bacterium]|nr:hypothetical protein [Polyangiaceae bacterium]